MNVGKTLNKSDEVEAGQIYRHYKGNFYKIIAVAVDTESKSISELSDITDAEKRVIYQRISGDVALCGVIWSRPYQMFIETIEVEGILQKRFILQN